MACDSIKRLFALSSVGTIPGDIWNHTPSDLQKLIGGHLGLKELARYGLSFCLFYSLVKSGYSCSRPLLILSNPFSRSDYRLRLVG